MTLKCDTCGKRFPTNTSLYIHKRTHNPSLVLMAHNHKDGNLPRRKTNPQHDPGLTVIDSYDDKGRKRTRNDSDDDDGGKSPKRKRDPQHDPNLTIIDSYDDDGGRSPKKKPDSENDDNLTIIDSYDDDGGTTPKRKPDSEDDDGLQVIDSYDRIPRRRPKPYSVRSRDYKSLYKECVKEKKHMDKEFREKIKDLKRRHASDLSSLERKKADELSHVHSQYDKDMRDKQQLHDKQQSDLEKIKDGECDEKIKQIEKKCEDEKRKIRETFMRQFADEEEECTKKLKLLNDQIKSLQEDDENLNSLTKAIFNCTTMEEIYEIQRLIKNHQLDVVVQNHLPTLQNLFLSLSYGILPICQPQREKVSDEQ